MIRSLAALGLALPRAALIATLATAPALAQVQPSAPVASKGYVDTGLAAGIAAIALEKARAQAAEGLLLPKAGGTMTGPVVLAPGSTGPADGMSVPLPGRTVAPTLGAIFGLTAQVEFFRRPEDGADWGPGLQRAQAFLATTGGMLRVSTPGALIIATQVSLPKGNPPLTLRCDSRASMFTAAASLGGAMFSAGGAAAPGGLSVEIDGCGFAGGGIGSGRAFALNNANGMTIRRSNFVQMSSGVAAASSYAVTLEDTTFDGVTSPFYSSTAAHNFVARRVKAYGGGTTLRFDAPTDNISVVESDFEINGTPLQMAGGTGLRFVGNYVEYMANDPIYSTAPLYGTDFSNNWLALGQSNWNVVNWVGGQIKGNAIYSQSVTFGSGTVDVEVGDNVATGGAQSVNPTGSKQYATLAGFIQPSPYQVPTLANGWTQQTNYSSVGFRKGRDGKVYLRGNLLNGTAALGTAAFTLPTGYRPGTQRVFMAAGSSGPTTVTINGDGNVYVTAAGGAGTNGNPYQAGLDGIAFEPGA